MKFTVLLALSLFSASTFAQDTCSLRIEKLREKLAEVSNELRMCQSSQPDRGEVEYLRRENNRLQDLNVVLQMRIDELEGRGREQYFCSAGCVSVSGIVDTRYLMEAEAPTQLEADLLAKKAVQGKYSCNYGIKTYKCEVIRSEIQRNFCTAACVSVSGTPDERYSGGARGRNQLEAEILAIKDVKKNYNCNYGIKVISCN